MGLCGEHAAKTHGFTREQQDEFAIRSYKLGAESTAKGLFKSEIVPVEVPQKKGNPVVVSEDEEFKKANFDKIKQLKPAFDKNGSVTAANSSSLNDGASALVLMAAEKAQELGLKPIARIRGFADAETLPIDFPVAPALAIPKLLKQTGVNINDVDFWEINEAFAVVILANMKLLGIPVEKVNVRGGAIALGHPIGASGARIITSLAHLLQQTPSGKIGVAAICNGGGGASSIMIEKF
jgi:acetyl-CoA C-acetyltransferase